MSTVFIFCNLGFGKPFLKQFIEASKDFSHANFIVIISGNKNRPAYRNFTLKLKTSKYLWPWRNNISIKIINNVNSEKFINSIPRSSFGIVSGFNQIFNETTILKFDRIINIHPSILPHYRGAIPSYWAIKNKEIRSGFTIHQIIRKIDKGAIIHQEYIDIHDNDSEQDLDQRIADRASQLISEILNLFINNIQFECKVLESPYRTPVDYVPMIRD